MSIRTLYVGNWGFHPAPKGISVFDFHEGIATEALRIGCCGNVAFHEKLNGGNLWIEPDAD